jgi:hypothetical protein
MLTAFIQNWESAQGKMHLILTSRKELMGLRMRGSCRFFRILCFTLTSFALKIRIYIDSQFFL